MEEFLIQLIYFLGEQNERNNISLSVHMHTDYGRIRECIFLYAKKKKKKVKEKKSTQILLYKCKYDKSTCKFVIYMVNWKSLPTWTTQKPRRLIIIQSVICWDKILQKYFRCST